MTWSNLMMYFATIPKYGEDKKEEGMTDQQKHLMDIAKNGFK